MEIYYQASRIEKLLAHWLELPALAESPQSSRGLLQAGPTRESLKVGAHQPGHHGDPNTWSDVRADIERAWIQLTHNSIESRVIEARMHGHRVGQFAHEYHLASRDVHEANDRAIASMARYLEGELATAFEPAELRPRTRACDGCGTPFTAYHAADRFCPGGNCRKRTWKAEQRQLATV